MKTRSFFDSNSVLSTSYIRQDGTMKTSVASKSYRVNMVSVADVNSVSVLDVPEIYKSWSIIDASSNNQYKPALNHDLASDQKTRLMEK